MMNGTEQRAHTRVTDTLSERIATLETVTEGLAAQLVKDRDAGQQAVDGERAARGLEHRTLTRRLDAFGDWLTDWHTRGLLARVRWLVTGR